MQGPSDKSGKPQDNTSTRVGTGRGGASDYQPGFQINKAYEVINLIGHGGMGAVYRVRHLFLSKEMALKVLPSDQVSDTSWRRFQIEAQAIARLNHPNVVRIFDMGMIDDKTPYYAMELLNGQSLADLLKRKQALPVTEALTIFRQVCAGLAYAHEHQIIHRDIKPANIVLLESDNGVSAKLVDFGIAKLTGLYDGDKQGLTRPGEVFGSPQYMSPEQCAGTAVDHRTDLYSLGCALFETLTGVPPFRGKDAMETVDMHQNAEAPTLFEASEGVSFSDALEDLIKGLLAKNPADRFQSASDVAAELLSVERSFVDKNDKVKGPQTASAVRKPFSSRSNHDDDDDKKASSKNPLIFAGVAVVALGLVIGGAVFFMAGKKTETPGSVNAVQEAARLKEAEANRVDALYKAEAESKEPYFQGTLNKDGHQVSHFKFNPDISIGTLEAEAAGVAECEAKGDIYIPTRAVVHFTPNYECLRNPHIMRRFDDGTIWILSLTSLTDDLTQVVDPAREAATKKDTAAATTSGTATDDKAVDDDKLSNGAVATGGGAIRSDLVNNDILKNVVQIKSIYSIDLSNGAVTNECLVTLGRFPKLVELKISNTAIDGEQLVQSGLLPNLELLHMGAAKKISAVLSSLHNSTKMRQLHLERCRLTDQDLEELGTMKKITRLKLTSNTLKDAALAPLTKLPLLYRLEVDDCGLTPACLKYIVAMKGLKQLVIGRNNMNDEQFEAFKSAVKAVRPDIEFKGDLSQVRGMDTLVTPPQ
jgi:serine/threonine protein kinase